MTRVCAFLLAFCFLTGCHSPENVPVIKDPATKPNASDPFDRQGQLIFTRHARCRMGCRHITAKEIHEILDAGTINYTKSEPDAHPDPKYAVEGFTTEQQHLRIVVAPEGQKLIVITCIELGTEWKCDCN